MVLSDHKPIYALMIIKVKDDDIVDETLKRLQRCNTNIQVNSASTYTFINDQESKMNEDRGRPGHSYTIVESVCQKIEQGI